MIGLSMASAVRHVWGIEARPTRRRAPLSDLHSSRAISPSQMCEAAVLDARRNATRNGVVNASFVAGKAEDKIESVLRGLTSQQKARCLPPLLP